MIEFPDFSIYDILICCFEIEDVIMLLFMNLILMIRFHYLKAYPQKKFEYVLFGDGFKVKALRCP